jgi:hypothetical protein
MGRQRDHLEIWKQDKELKAQRDRIDRLEQLLLQSKKD